MRWRGVLQQYMTHVSKRLEFVDFKSQRHTEKLHKRRAVRQKLQIP